MRTHSVALACLLGASGLGMGGTGCSFLFVDGPPAAHRKLDFFDCTTSNALPIVDLILAGLVGISALGDGTAGQGEDTQRALLVAQTGVLVVSGLYGFSKTSACRVAHADLMRRLGSRGAAPAVDPWQGGGSWGAPPVPPPPPPLPTPAPAPEPAPEAAPAPSGT
jgi:hypothetical protein